MEPIQQKDSDLSNSAEISDGDYLVLPTTSTYLKTGPSSS